VEFKANPRTEDYMLDLLRERRGSARLVRWEDDPDPAAALSEADEVVLLYPDATGIGFRPIEARVRRLAGPQAKLTVINGRRREFPLDRRTRRGLLLRRAAERSMVGELCASLVIIALTPVLLAIDYARGRR
jgi:hypothetical protein